MKYSFDFDNKSKSRNKKIIFAIIFMIFVIVFCSYFFKNSSNTFVSKISSYIIAPFDFVYHFFADSFSGATSYLGNIKKINEENQELKKENDNLKYKLLEKENLEKENESLKKMLEIKNNYQHFGLKLGKIIYREHDNWSQTFKIDIGKNDGIKLNQAVIHTNGLVGYISNVEDNTSTVTTILDPTASVSVNISTINEPAVLKGDLTLKSENKLKLTFIPLGTEISISDMLYTSGLGSMYKATIPVGKIVEIVNDKNDTDRYAIVEPNVNIRTISEVGVIIN